MDQLLLKYSSCPEPYESRNNEDFRALMERKAAQEHDNHDDNSDQEEDDAFAELEKQGQSSSSAKKSSTIQTQIQTHVKQRRFPPSKPSPIRAVNFDAFQQQYAPLSPMSRQLGAEFQQVAQNGGLPSLSSQLGYLNTPNIANYSPLNNPNVFNWAQQLDPSAGQFDYNLAPVSTEVSPKRRFTETIAPAVGKGKDVFGSADSLSNIQSIKKARI